MQDIVKDLNEFLMTCLSIDNIRSFRSGYDIASELDALLLKYGGNKELAYNFFYENTEFYLWDLAISSYEQDRNSLTNNLIEYSRKLNVSKIFDFGCGIGTDLIGLHNNGFIVSGCDVGRHAKFAKWRVAKYKYSIPIYNVFNNDNYDLIHLMAVLEHIWEPINLIKYLSKFTKYFSWKIDLSVGEHLMHYSEFFEQLYPLTYQDRVDIGDGIILKRAYSEMGWPQFYEVSHE